MSGAPIYLVSACTSGEEFVAAFRRYADKSGLFVPIREPLPAGSRGRFAVALKDGGVMIEGEAEVIASARTASVLHGRVGMTLRFLETDDASKTLLGELEKARLAMKPPPPSVQPRPAEIPAEPRPVPPPAQGRIDAVNALAECVAIGDVAGLGPAAATVPVSAPPKAGPRFVVPTVPTVSAMPPAGPGGASRPSAAPKPSATPKAPVASPASAPLPPGERRTDPPQPVPVISGFSQTMTAVAPLADPGPTSDTLTAATPPEPPAVRPEAFARTLVGGPVATPGAVAPSGPRRATEMPAVQAPPIPRPHAALTPATATPVASAPVASAPLVSASVAPAPAGAAPIASVAPPSPPVQPARSRIASDTLTEAPVPGMSAVEPGRGRIASDTLNAVPVPNSMPASSPTDIGAPLVEPLSPNDLVEVTPSSEDASARTQVHAGIPPRESPPPPPAASAGPDWESHGSTHIGMPPIPRAATPASPLPAVLRPAPPIVAPPRPPVPEVEIAEPTDLTSGPPEPPVEPSPPEDVSSTVPEIPLLRPRKTAIGVVIAPSGVNVPPAAGSPTAVVAAVAGGDTSDVIDVSLLMADEASDEVTGKVTDADPGPVTPASALAALAAPVAPVSSPAKPGGLPTGNWAIALDPEAPDGWSEPFRLVTPASIAAATPPSPSPLLPSPPPAPSPSPPPAPSPSPPPPPVAASAPPRDHAPKRPTPHPDALPILEPKVQIDPTLIEPLQAMPPDAPLVELPVAAAASPPIMPGYGIPPDAGGVALPMNLMTPVPQPLPFPAVQVPPAIPGGQVPDYPMDPSYGTMPMRGLPTPELLSAGGSGSGLGAQYASETALPVHTGRRHVVIILVSALVAVVIGIVVIVVLRGRHSAGAPAHIDPARPGARAAAPPSSPAGSPTPTPPPAVAPAAPVPSSTAVPADAGAAVAAAAVAGAAAAGAAPPGADTCFADVSSVPPGADIVIDQTNVIGTTPQKVTLPCGAPVELLIRKARFVPVTHTVTPTPDGAKLKVALAKPTFLVKVSSTPAGATVSMNGKSLGVTPTTIKIPAFELSTLTIAKDGYATEAEKVTPKSNGVAVHTALKKLERKKPR